jgi:hypothetical protein
LFPRLCISDPEQSVQVFGTQAKTSLERLTQPLEMGL